MCPPGSKNESPAAIRKSEDQVYIALLKKGGGGGVENVLQSERKLPKYPNWEKLLHIT